MKRKYDIWYECPHCEKPAFYYTHFPKLGDIAHAKFAYKLPGLKRFIEYQAINCQHCERNVSYLKIERIKTK